MREKFSIKFKIECSRKIDGRIDVKLADTWEIVKEKIKEASEIDEKKQILMYEGKLPRDGLTLYDYNVEPSRIIVVRLKNLSD